MLTNEELATAIDGLNLSSEQLKALIAESGSGYNTREQNYTAHLEDQVVIETAGTAQKLLEESISGHLTVANIGSVNVAIGDSSTTLSKGFLLLPGDRHSYYQDDLSTLYFVGDSGAKVAYSVEYYA